MYLAAYFANVVVRRFGAFRAVVDEVLVIRKYGDCLKCHNGTTSSLQSIRIVCTDNLEVVCPAFL